MIAVVLGFLCVLAGTILILNDMMWGEFLCLFGVFVVGVRTLYIKNDKVVKEVDDVDIEAPMEQQAKKDLNDAIAFIRTHPKSQDIVSMYKKGPPPDTGFMWCPHDWFSPAQQEGLKIMRVWVLGRDWDSSAYGYMQRMIQQHVRTAW